MNENTQRLADLQARIMELNKFLSYIGKPSFKADLDNREISIVLAIGLNSYNMKQLSGYFKENNSTMTGIIDRMEKKGIITRNSGSRDRRVVLISLSKKWRRKYNSHIKSQEWSAKYAYENITQERFDLLMKLLLETNDCFNEVFPWVKKG